MSANKKIFGVIGDPVAHSLSPDMHNAAHQHLKIPAEYKRFHVLANDLESFFERIRSGEISGVNVTIPHKQAVMVFCDELTPEAEKMGAVNTVYRQDEKIMGANTDGRGYLRSLLEDFTLNLSQLNVVVIGAGGASLAVCHALCESQVASLTIANRSVDKAQNLAARLQMHHPDLFLQSVALEKLSLICDEADLMINTTSLGMRDQDWPDLNFLKITPQHAIISDVVYKKGGTTLLNAAQKLGLKTHDGLGMLLYQGVIAFELFTGQKAPIAVMRDALLKALSQA